MERTRRHATFIMGLVLILGITLLGGCGGMSGKQPTIDTFQASSESITAGESVTFTVTGEITEGMMSSLNDDFSLTVDLLVDGESVASELNEDAGLYVSEYEQSLSHAFDTAGSYDVTATATATDGGTVVESENSIPITVEAAVAVDVTGIELDDTSVSIDVDGTHTFSYTITPSDATDTGVSWSTSDPSVADFADYPSNKIIGQGNGTATITVTTDDGGFTDTCTVSVGDTSPPDGSSFAKALSVTAFGSPFNANSVSIPYNDDIYYEFTLSSDVSQLRLARVDFPIGLSAVDFQLYRDDQSEYSNEEGLPDYEGGDYYYFNNVPAGTYCLRLYQNSQLRDQSGDLLLWSQ